MRVCTIVLLCTFALLAAPVSSAEDLPFLWNQRFGNPAEQLIQSLAVDADGNIIVAGDFEGSINLGGDWLHSLGDKDIFIAKFDPDGNHLWSDSFGSTEDQIVRGVSVLSGGHILLGGAFRNQINFGGGTLYSAGDHDVFAAKFYPNGVHFWSHRYGDDQRDICFGVSNGNGGMTYLAGYFMGSIDFGGGPLVSAGLNDVWVAILDGSGGNHLFSWRFGDEQDQGAWGIAGDPQGALAITGYARGTIDFGGGPLTSAGGPDAFVASLEFGGAHRWSYLRGDQNAQYGVDVSFQPSTDEVVAVGQFQTSINWGGSQLNSAGSLDTYMVKFAANGAHVWSERYGGPEADYPRGVHISRLNTTIALTGLFSGTAQFGGDPLTSAGDTDVYIATYDVDGNHLTSQRAGDASAQTGMDIWCDDDGQVIAIGNFEEAIDFGGGAMTSAGDFDAYLVKFGVASGIGPESVIPPLVQLGPLSNPARSGVEVVYSLSRPGQVRLDLLDVQGRRLDTLVNGPRPAGSHTATWWADGMAGAPATPGVVFIRLAVDGKIETRRIVLVE